MPLKASELVAKVQEHIQKHGDDNIMLYDEYAGIYKSLSPQGISVNNQRLVIECAAEDDVE